MTSTVRGWGTTEVGFIKLDLVAGPLNPPQGDLQSVG